MTNDMNILDDDKELGNKIYPPLLVVVLAFLAFVFLGGIGAWLGNLVANLFDVDMQAVLKSGEGQSLHLEERQAIRWANLLSHLFAFTGAALLVTYFVKNNSTIGHYLGVDKGIKGASIIWSILALFLAFPAIQVIFWLNMQLPLPDWMMQVGENQDWLVAEVLNMEHVTELALVLLVAAVAPAIGEELLFRGLLQSQFIRFTKHPHWGVWITAFFFSAMHMQFAGFFPRFFLGALLGYLYLWSGSLWLPILIHFLFNGTQIILSYLFPEMTQTEPATSLATSELLIGIGAALLLIPVLKRIRASST